MRKQMSNYYEKLQGHSDQVNREELLERLCGSEQLVNKFIGVFKETFKEVAMDIEKEIEAHQFKEARTLVHKLKGSSGNLNLAQIYEKSCLLEEALKGEQIGETKDAFNALKGTLEAFFKIIE